MGWYLSRPAAHRAPSKARPGNTMWHRQGQPVPAGLSNPPMVAPIFTRPTSPVINTYQSGGEKIDIHKKVEISPASQPLPSNLAFYSFRLNSILVFHPAFICHVECCLVRWWSALVLWPGCAPGCSDQGHPHRLVTRPGFSSCLPPGYGSTTQHGK